MSFIQMKCSNLKIQTLFEIVFMNIYRMQECKEGKDDPQGQGLLPKGDGCVVRSTIVYRNCLTAVVLTVLP
jgi:hypothetical protein